MNGKLLCTNVQNGIAPFESARSPAADQIVTRRRRRRGPRSSFALLRRSPDFRSGAPAGAAIGQSMTHAPISSQINSQPFTIYSINIRCLLKHLSELCDYVNIFAPHIVLVQESWLNASIENVNIPNYQVLSRKD